MIETRKLTKFYRTETVKTTALNEIDLSIAAGEFVSIMGPSGSGKSTLLNILGLIDAPSSGQLEFLGQEVSSLSEKKLAEVRKNNIGFVFQSFNLIDELSVLENVELPLRYQGVAAAERQERAEAELDRMEILHRKDHLPQQLSGGQQQRVAVARAVVGRPKMILADEPTGNLDSASGAEVINLLHRLNEAGAAVVMVTHSEECAAHAERVVRMMDGRVAA